MAALIVTSGGHVGARYLLDKPIISIGRGSGCDIRIADKRVSRQHARIRVEGNRYILEDQQGRNTTFVNDRPVEFHVLSLDDVIRIAGVCFRFEADLDLSDMTVRTELEVPPPSPRSPHDLPIREKIDGLDLRASIIGSVPALLQQTLAPAQERLLTVIEIANAISTHLDQDQLLEEILGALLRIFRQAARATLLTLDAESGTLVARRERTREGSESVPRFPMSQRVLKQVLQEKQAVIFGGIDAAPGSIAGMLSNSMLCAPLAVRGEVLGAIHMTSMNLMTPFVRADLDLLVGVASQAAIAVKNADMHAQLVARERLRHDLEVAQEIQRRFLPLRPPRLSGWAFAAEYKPALAIGGDFYDFIPLGDDRMAIIIGDVSGKGVSGALLMARMTSEFRMLAVTKRDPADVMASVNASLIAASYEGLFVTATYAVLDLAQGVVTFSNAGHLRPMVRRYGVQTVETFETADVPLGVMDDTIFTQESFSLGYGDVLMLMSDGVIESTNAERRQLGLEPVEKVLREGGADAEATIEDVMGLVRRFVKDAPQFDDLTIVSVGRELPSVRELAHELEPPTRIGPSPGHVGLRSK